MANHKSALKRWRQNEKRRLRNRHWKTTMRSAIKTVREAVSNNEVEVAKTALHDAISMIAHVASKGVIHKKTASRRISRLSLLVNKMQAEA